MTEIISRLRFEILKAYAENNSADSVFSNYQSIDNEEIEEEIAALEKNGFLSSGAITEKGKQMLEPYTVKRAVFMAAGFGSRLSPITINTPKPLVRVNGARIIDGLIDACLDAGIDEIIIVTGYLSEQFDQLLYKYPQIKFVNNPCFETANNISSMYQVRDKLSNAYVFEADLFISNPSIISKYHYTSDFLAIYKDHTDDWCFDVENNIIVKEKVGGSDCWQMVGISYWNEDDGKKLERDIESIFSTDEGKDVYWEQVPLKYCQADYSVEIVKCFDEDIVEIDTYDELAEIDDSYKIS